MKLTGIAAIASLVFALTGPAQAGNVFQVLHSFCSAAACADGELPSGGLVTDGSGNLYGVTEAGGPRGGGTIFEIVAPQGTETRWHEKVLYSFCNGSTCSRGGNDPVAPLVIDTAGNLYGTTVSGYKDPYFGGTAFELSPNTDRSVWTLHTLHIFCSWANCADGEFPYAGLAYAGQQSGAPYDGASPLFGATNGSAAGVVYKLVKRSSGWREQVIYTFCPNGDCSTGASPTLETLLVDSKLNVYGTTANGGDPYSGGVVFKLSRVKGGAWSGRAEYKFCERANCADGGTPSGSVSMDAIGNLYGATARGGLCSTPDQCGTLFRIDAPGSETVIHSFCTASGCPDGWGPNAGPIVGPEGTLYGTTEEGGANGQGGTVYRMSNGRFRVLHSFCARPNCADGSGANAPVIVERDGALYGITRTGGAHNAGVVFRLAGN